MQLFTCRYQKFHAGLGIPVRTTVGLPRFALPYELGGHARLITPTWAMVSLHDEAAYTTQYRQHLDAAGVEAIRAELLTLAASHVDRRLVLLCFDDLSRPDGWCHRRMFADWWQDLTSEPVPELAEPRPSALF